jgi:ActR/RegA family two-component response regulator
MKPSVLLLDDDPKWLQIYHAELPQINYTLETTSSFSDALQRLAAKRYPVVVSDLRLVGIGNRGGFELLTRAKTISEYTKVIIITAYGGAATDIAREAMEKGAITYLTKPLDFAELDECIVMAIQSWQQEVEAMVNIGFLTDGPELVFLYGVEAPMPESIIEPASDGEEYDVFLTYNSDDKLAVEQVARRLTKAGIRPWLDQWNLIPGEPWMEAIEEALERCRTCAVFIGPSGTGPWQNEEMRAALDHAVRTRSDYRIIPVLLPGANEASLTSFLARRAWVDFQLGLNDANAFARLVAGILGQPPEQAGSTSVQEGNV